MVVVVIVGILATMFTLSVGVTGGDRELEREVDRLRALVALAGEEAVIQGRELGLRFYRGGYEFAALDPDEGRWVTVSGDELFEARELPEGLELELILDGRVVRLADAPGEVRPERDEDGNEPQVFIYSSGDVSPPFRATLRRRFGDDGLAIEVELDGSIDVLRDPA